jgi:2,3-bisphosphoglycerate-dependent phosphoglycerate mutase
MNCQPRITAGINHIFSRDSGRQIYRDSLFRARSNQLQSVTLCERNFSSSHDPKDKNRGGLSSFDDGGRKVIIGRTPRSRQSKNRSTSDAGSGSDQFIQHIINGGVPCDPVPTPFQLANFGEESLYTLVLLRHGESEWNKLNRYTGWCDVGLTEKGETEARDAGRLLHENGINIDHAYTSVLKRASFSCNMALNTAKQHYVPVTKSWRLNERHYGALQGYNKDTAYKELEIDQELVMQMRRSYGVRPPVMQDDHPFWHGNDRR